MQHDQETFELDIRAVKRAEADLCISKNRDYGPFNIARAPGGPINGLAVRLHDKIARLAHLLETGADPEHESVQDTFMDIANYGSIGTMIVRGLWPGTDEEKDRQPVEESLPARFSVGDRVRAKAPGYAGVGEIVRPVALGDFHYTVEMDDGHRFNFKTDELELL